jgi:hypothetical protein
MPVSHPGRAGDNIRRMPLSRLLYVRQNFPDRSLPDIPGEVRRQLAASGFATRLQPGSRVAIGVGSRGISNIDIIVREAVRCWQDMGMRPFLFPAMGSHGAATAEGQAKVLAHYGITEATMGCPVMSSLDVVAVGETPDGIEAFMDRNAYESDGVMLIGRVKWHTDFNGGIESGLFKMMAIGLGKFAGAKRYHSWAYKLGLERVIRTVGRQVLSSGKILGGLAILEDAHHRTAKIAAVPVDSMETREEELLALTKSWMGRIPCPLDILIVDQIGKNFSGAGMDTKVVNRGVAAEYKSYGNAVGFGMADMVHSSLLPKIDWTPTRINALTSNTPACIRTPIHFDTDRACLEQLWPTVGRFNEAEIRIGWIRNSLHLAEIALTENVGREIRENAQLEIVSGPSEWPFDSAGNLPELLPAEVFEQELRPSGVGAGSALRAK